MIQFTDSYTPHWDKLIPHGQNGRHFTRSIFTCIFMNVKFSFWFKFQWSLLLRFQLTISEHWFRRWLGAEQPPNHYLNQCWPCPLTYLSRTKGRRASKHFTALQWRPNGHDNFSNHHASRSFTQPFIQTQIKENIKAPCYWPLCGEFTGHRWFPRTNGQ